MSLRSWELDTFPSTCIPAPAFPGSSSSSSSSVCSLLVLAALDPASAPILLLREAVGQVELPVPRTLLQAHDRIPHRLQVLRDVLVLVALVRELRDQSIGALEVVKLPLQDRELRVQLLDRDGGLPAELRGVHRRILQLRQGAREPVPLDFPALLQGLVARRDLRLIPHIDELLYGMGVPVLELRLLRRALVEVRRGAPDGADLRALRSAEDPLALPLREEEVPGVPRLGG